MMELEAVVADGASPVGAILAIALALALVDIPSLGITGGLILGAADPAARAPLFCQLLTCGLASVVAPVLACAALGWW